MGLVYDLPADRPLDRSSGIWLTDMAPHARESVGVFRDSGSAVPYLVARARGWRALAAKWLEAHPACAACGSEAECVPHHVEPVHVAPEKELDDGNLVTLCPDHHLLFGHLMDWRSWNELVRSDAGWWRDKIRRRPGRPAEGEGGPCRSG